MHPAIQLELNRMLHQDALARAERQHLLETKRGTNPPRPSLMERLAERRDAKRRRRAPESVALANPWRY